MSDPVNAGDSAKAYLIRNGVWDDDPWICADKIAAKITTAADGEAAIKYGRRAITALCEVYAQTHKAKR